MFEAEIKCNFYNPHDGDGPYISEWTDGYLRIFEAEGFYRLAIGEDDKETVSIAARLDTLSVMKLILQLTGEVKPE